MGSWVSGISVMCFAASYTVSLALEVSRLWFRSGVRGAIMIGFAIAGMFAHTLFLGYRAYHAPNLPLSSAQDWYLMAAWILAAAYLYFALNQAKAAIGVFLLPLVLALVGVSQLADTQPFDREPALQMWRMAHGVFILLGLVSVAVSFVAGLMYLIQAGRLKRKRLPPQGFRLPSLEWLETLAGRALWASLSFLGVGLLSGAVLNLVKHFNLVNHHSASAPVSWTNPLILSSATMFLLMLGMTLFNVFFRPVDASRKVFYLTVLTFLFLVTALGLNLLMPHASTSPTVSQL